jgi:hypothetical protein
MYRCLIAYTVGTCFTDFLQPSTLVPPDPAVTNSGTLMEP